MATLTIGNTTENAILNLVFAATAWTNYAINHTTTPQVGVGISLHTGTDPGDAADATTQEMTVGAYNTYVRVNKTRDNNISTGWTVSTVGSISPQSNIDFPAGVSGTGATATWFITAAANTTPPTPPTGAQIQLWRGDISPSIACGAGVTPRLTTGTVITLD